MTTKKCNKRKTCTHKKKGGIAWMPLAVGANAGLGLINSIVSMIKHSRGGGTGYTRRGPMMKRGFTTA